MSETSDRFWGRFQADSDFGGASDEDWRIMIAHLFGLPQHMQHARLRDERGERAGLAEGFFRRIEMDRAAKALEGACWIGEQLGCDVGKISGLRRILGTHLLKTIAPKVPDLESAANLLKGNDRRDLAEALGELERLDVKLRQRSAQPNTKAKLGRRIESDLERDALWYEKWKTGGYTSLQDCADALGIKDDPGGAETGMAAKKLAKAIDRYRKRMKR